MNILRLTSPIPPSVNHYLGRRNIIKDGKPVSISYKTKAASQYSAIFKEHIQQEVERQKWAPPKEKNRHFYVDAVFYFPRMRMDCNNCWKLLLDTITETQLIWADDNVVCERVQGIFYDSKNPHIDIQIRPVDYIGVFENTPQMEEFISNCLDCARYARNCSILNKAMCGKIQEDVTNQVCAKYKRCQHGAMLSESKEEP